MSNVSRTKARATAAVTSVDESARPLQPNKSDTSGRYTDLPALNPGWWPVAHSGDLADKPIGARLAETGLAIYRDATGTARTVLDRCPHRRMPLSLGRITPDGLLQCGYHGWSFNGSGQCKLIPNFRPGESPSARIIVDAFATEERGGLIFVHSRGIPAGPVPEALSEHGDSQISGRLEVRSPHSSVVGALAFNPGAALGLGLLLGSGEEVIGPRADIAQQQISVVRERLTVDLPRVTTFDAPVKRSTQATIEIHRDTGFTFVTSELPRGATVRAVIGASPVGPYRTMIFWQLHVSGLMGAAAAAATAFTWSLRSRLGHAARVFETVADNADMTYDPVLQALRGE
jgi:nitrite reductase/ring-hydroxylating ferredoxin subunit